MSYKAQENKVFHRGAYIGYCVMPDGRRFTTNGSIMVEGEIDTQPVKGQQDLRNQEMKPITDAQLIKVIGSAENVEGGSEYDDATEILKSHSHTHAVDKEYSHYLQVKYPGLTWVLSEEVLVVVDNTGRFVAILAPKNIDKVKMKGDDSE